MEVTSDLIDNARKLKILLEAKDEVEQKLDVIKKEIAEFQSQFVELMDLRDVQNFSVRDLGTFYVNASVIPKVTNQVELFGDLRRRGAGDLIKETVNSNTLRAYVKECLDEKNEIPKGIEIFTRSAVRVRKYK